MGLHKTEMQTAKEHWRKKFKTLLQKESPHSSVQVQAHLRENLLTYLGDRQGVWAGYHALPQEPDLGILFRQTPRIEWAFPRMESHHLSFYISQNFIKGPFDVLEPAEDETEKLGLEEMQGILVPGLGFNKKGRRLGRGKGYYDRALEDYKGLKVGVCFSCQVVGETLPAEPHDVAVDVLVTENEVVICG